ncbi:MAG: hypothetical protein ACK2UK_21050 [Candidatus Promineifilaceae bacterium]
MVFNILLFAVGAIIVIGTFASALSTLILPRGTRDIVTHTAFRLTWLAFSPLMRFANSYERRDRIMAFYAPITVMLVVVAWLVLVLLGYMLMYFAMGISPLAGAFRLSGSSLLTLGFATVDTVWLHVLVFSEAAIGLGLVALLIAYLPTMYTAFSRREEAVNLLEVRAGSPPSAVEWLIRAQRNDMLGRMSHTFEPWEHWFAALEESHTSLLPLSFFRSPHPDRSWITASGAVLDTAAMMMTVIDFPYDEMPLRLTSRAGYLALRNIADLFNIEYNADPEFPEEPISVSRAEFDEACSRLAEAGIPLYQDLDEAWLRFGSWRVNYDRTLIALAALIRAPYAPWSSDRSATGMNRLTIW